MMNKKNIIIFVITLIIITCIIRIAEYVMPETSFPSRKTYGLNVDTSRLPIYFEKNCGQADENIKYMTRGAGYSFLFTSLGMSMIFPSDTISMTLEGIKASSTIEGLMPEPGKANYFIGNDSSKWKRDIPFYKKVRYKNVYPGIDIVFYGNQGTLEHDFIVSPGADPNDIVMKFNRPSGIKVDNDGNLIITLKDSEVVWRKPFVYQEINGKNIAIKGRYELIDDNKAHFLVASYNRNKKLIIDPVLSYSTYIGGTGDERNRSLSIDDNGNIYLVGSTTSTDFPRKNAYQYNNAGDWDVFVTKIDPTGTNIIYSTYIGGTGSDQSMSIYTDSDANAYITGYTASTNYPCFRAVYNTFKGANDVFITKLNQSGNGLLFSSYLGGTGDDYGYCVILDLKKNIIVSGYTSSADFPVLNALYSTFRGGTYDCFITKINQDTSAITYSTYFGGGGNDYTGTTNIDSEGNIFLLGYTNSDNIPISNAVQATRKGGYDAFIAKLNPNATSVIYSTYIGGSNDETISLAKPFIDSQGNAYFPGYTSSTDYPTKNPYQSTFRGGTSDGIFTKLNATGNALLYSTYIGGSGDDVLYFAIVDSFYNAYITGITSSTDFPLRYPIQNTYGGGAYDGLIVKLSTTGEGMQYSTYMGGNDTEGYGQYNIVTDKDANIYFAASTSSRNFPRKNAMQNDYAGGLADGFIVKIVESSFTIDPTSSTQKGMPGLTATHIIKIRNNGSTDTYTLDILNTGGLWTTNLPMKVGPVKPQTEVSVSINVNIPENAKENDTNTSVIQATSSLDTNNQKTATLTSTASYSEGGSTSTDPNVQYFVAGNIPASTQLFVGNVAYGIICAATTSNDGPSSVSIEKFKANPVATGTFSALFADAFYDLRVMSNPNNIKEILLKLYYPQGVIPPANSAYWYNGKSYTACSKQEIVPGTITINGTTFDGYVQVIADNSTSPNIAQLTGTYFALGKTGAEGISPSPVPSSQPSPTPILPQIPSFFPIDSAQGGGGDSGGGGHCFIATAAFGSYQEHHVKVLRAFRDKFLMSDKNGRLIVSYYYHYSPPVADWIKCRKWARLISQEAIIPFYMMAYFMLYPVKILIILIIPAVLYFVYILYRAHDLPSPVVKGRI